MRDRTTQVDAITPIRRGANVSHLYDALVSALRSLGAGFHWYYACHPDDLADVQHVVIRVRSDTDHWLNVTGHTTASTNVAATRNQLLAAGDSDYVAQLDADDLWVPGGLAHMKAELDRSADTAAAHGRHFKVDSTAEIVVDVPPEWRFVFPHSVVPPGTLAVRRREMTRIGREFYGNPDYVAVYPIHPSAGLFRRSVVEDVGGWDEELGNYFEDSVLVAKIQTKCFWHVDRAPVLLYRTLQPESLSQRRPGKKAWKILDELAIAHEADRPPSRAATPFPTPPAERIVPVA